MRMQRIKKSETKFTFHTIDTVMEVHSLLVLFSGLILFAVLWVGGMTVWLIRDTRRGDRHLSEIAHLNAVDARAFSERVRRSEEESRRLMADHDLMMRMILERVDKPRN